ncbi:hypothetical protein F5J12DRAFT_786042 [Pisolithus orientalis]|uniref:uncharacterized protein n=1 Tax=Pisolithus orientalis TaxID=936130 RepID=UPI00222544F3|nr:uncharacterized protein F5J12DRAFT_786042 [Pisolithus orientalis]KAI5993049.1 hypothetical protein F5J12DRAFT_786042 [Pisolithus orientalis]
MAPVQIDCDSLSLILEQMEWHLQPLVQVHTIWGMTDNTDEHQRTSTPYQSPYPDHVQMLGDPGTWFKHIDHHSQIPIVYQYAHWTTLPWSMLAHLEWCLSIQAHFKGPACHDGEWSDRIIGCITRHAIDIGESGKDVNVDRGFGSGTVFFSNRSIAIELGGMNTTSSSPACSKGEWSDGNIRML